MTTPEITLMSVDLPAPLSPRRASTSGRQTSRLTPFSADTAPNALRMPLSFRSGGPLASIALIDSLLAGRSPAQPLSSSTQLFNLSELSTASTIWLTR